MATLALTGLAYAQSNSTQTDSARSATFDVGGVNGLSIHCHSTAPEGLDWRSVVSVTTPGGVPVLHRLIVDRTHGVYFGYDLYVAALAGSPQVRLHFLPLSAMDSFRTDLAGLRPAPLLLAPADVTVGQQVVVDLPVKAVEDAPPVVDHLSFTATAPAPQP